MIYYFINALRLASSFFERYDVIMILSNPCQTYFEKCQNYQHFKRIMSDEDEEDINVFDININPSEIKRVIANDLAAVKRRNDVEVEETKARISGFVSKYGEMLNCCSPREEDQDQVEDFEIHPVSSKTATSGMGSLVRKSLNAFTEKAKIDVQVLQLMDEEEIHLKKIEMQEFYKGTLNVTQKLGRKIQSHHTGTMKEIEETKKGFESTMKDLSSKLPLPVPPNRDESNFLAEFVKGVAEKSAVDFEETNKRSQAMAEAAKTDVSNYLNEVFPSHRMTLEQLQSEQFVHHDITDIRKKIARDFGRQNKSVQRSIEDTKTKVSQCPEEVFERVRNFSRMSAKKIRERALGLNEIPLEDGRIEEFEIVEGTSQIQETENNETSDET